jgi:ribonucleotide reductase beta subunit family protein with ferritin-like domain
MQIIDSIKTRFHSDMVSHPVIHGWVLNLYRGGERYPQRVCDYFQSDFAPTPELASALQRHSADENKHVRLFSRAINLLEQPVVEIEMGDIFNEVIRSFTPGTFHITQADPPDACRRKLANFLAHAHFLEKRVARSFAYHLDACEKAKKFEIITILSIAKQDEDRHVQYTREAVYNLLTKLEADAILETHRRVEAKANLCFSQMQVQIFLQKFSGVIPKHRAFLYKTCQMLMEGAGSYV